jgi:two-component system sensor histidine kinase EvgS
MAGLRIAAEKGYGVLLILRERHPEARIVEVDDSADALRAVSEFRADAYLGALPTTSFLVEKMLLANLEVRGVSHHSQSALHFGVPKAETVLLSIIDKALATLTLAERQEIHRRWTPLHSLLAQPSAPLVLSEDERRTVAATPALRVGYEADFSPYTFRTADGTMAGMGDDYLRLVAGKTGLRIAPPEGGRWSEILAQARRGETDLLVAVSHNEERARDFIFVGPWISTPYVLVTPKDASPVLSMTQYDGRLIAVLRGGQTAYLLTRDHPKIRLLPVDTRDDLLAAVANGQADAAFVNATLAAPRLAQGLGHVLKMAGFFPELNSDLYFAVRRDQPQIAALLARALSTINDGERAAIQSRWAVLPIDNEDLALRRLLRRLLPAFAAALAALLVSVLWAVSLKREVARRRKAEAQLAQARDHAEALAGMRRDFLTDASHEIRTPVNAVVGALGRLGPETLSPVGRELAALAQLSAHTLSEYVNNLLDLSKSDAGELRLVLQNASLDAAFGAAVQAIGPVAEAKGVRVERVMDANLAASHLCDEFRLRQVALNLLSNAVKFSDPGGRVVLHVEVDAEDGDRQALSLHVVDEGPGIEPERRAQLFRAFSQAGDSIAHRSGGSGLGLALCRRLLEAMDGSIEIKDNEPRGTRVTARVTLPVAEREPSVAEHGARHGVRALLVEDDRVQQVILEALLSQAGCSVDVAGSAGEAQSLWRDHRHPLVVTDIQLPSMSGMEFARWLRAQPGGDQVRLVGTSADVDSVSDARSAGIETLLQKPVAPATLREVVLSAGSRLYK